MSVRYTARSGCVAAMLCGGVCAFGITRDDVDVWCDDSMKRFETMFPACGSDNSAVELTLEELEKYSKARGWIDVCRFPEPEGEK